MIIVEIAGRLGADAETRFTPSGQKVTTLRMAVNVRRSGQEETVWWRVTIWGDRFDKMLPYLKKGTGLIVIGEMRGKPNTYVDKNGQTQVSLEITAEIIRFSPFGRTQEEGATGGYSAKSSSSNQSEAETGHPFGGSGMIGSSFPQSQTEVKNEPTVSGADPFAGNLPTTPFSQNDMGNVNFGSGAVGEGSGQDDSIPF